MWRWTQRLNYCHILREEAHYRWRLLELDAQKEIVQNPGVDTKPKWSTLTNACRRLIDIYEEQRIQLEQKAHDLGYPIDLIVDTRKDYAAVHLPDIIISKFWKYTHEDLVRRLHATISAADGYRDTLRNFERKPLPQLKQHSEELRHCIRQMIAYQVAKASSIRSFLYPRKQLVSPSTSPNPSNATDTDSTNIHVSRRSDTEGNQTIKITIPAPMLRTDTTPPGTTEEPLVRILRTIDDHGQPVLRICLSATSQTQNTSSATPPEPAHSSDDESVDDPNGQGGLPVKRLRGGGDSNTKSDNEEPPSIPTSPPPPVPYNHPDHPPPQRVTPVDQCRPPGVTRYSPVHRYAFVPSPPPPPITSNPWTPSSPPLPKVTTPRRHRLSALLRPCGKN